MAPEAARRGGRPAGLHIAGILALLLAGGAAAGADAPMAPAPVARVFLEELTWTELREAIAHGTTTAIVPIGGTEQSGPAIALGKHNARVQLLSGRIARTLGNAIVAPVVNVVPEGSITPPSGHMRFAGTLTVPPAVFDAQLESIVASLRAAGFRDIVLLADHGGNQDALQRLARRLDRAGAHEGSHVYAPAAYYRTSVDGFARLLREQGYRDDEIGTHAALADTSLQMAVDPSMVREELLHGPTRLDASVGVIGGDPRRATAAIGKQGLDAIVRESVAAIRADIAQAHGGAAAAH